MSTPHAALSDNIWGCQVSQRPNDPTFFVFAADAVDLGSQQAPAQCHDVDLEGMMKPVGFRHEAFGISFWKWYCWWKKSCTCDVWILVNNGIFTIYQLVQDFFHPHDSWKTRAFFFTLWFMEMFILHFQLLTSQPTKNDARLDRSIGTHASEVRTGVGNERSGVLPRWWATCYCEFQGQEDCCLQICWWFLTSNLQYDLYDFIWFLKGWYILIFRSGW